MGKRNGKQPRTVHIDVYCTGSDEDEEEDSPSASAEESSSDSDPSMQHYHAGYQNAMEVASNNSTNPTVYENFAMKVKHKRASREELPRKFLIDTPIRTPSYSNLSRGEYSDGDGE